MTSSGAAVDAASERGSRVGLLLCDRLDPDIAATVGDYTELFPGRFAPLGVELTAFDLTAGTFPTEADLAELDGWMISGSRRSVYEDEGWIRDLEALTRRLVEERRPLIGICFGHQMVAQALGGTVAAAEVGWGVGGRRFTVVDSAPWMDGGDAFTLLMSHQDQVTRLPDDAEVLATAEYCPVGAYRIGDHAFCVQGHPEWVPELSRILMGRRRDRIGAERVDEALATLDGHLDQDRVAGWIADFYAPPGGASR